MNQMLIELYKCTLTRRVNMNACYDLGTISNVNIGILVTSKQIPQPSSVVGHKSNKKKCQKMFEIQYANGGQDPSSLHLAQSVFPIFDIRSYFYIITNTFSRICFFPCNSFG